MAPVVRLAGLLVGTCIAQRYTLVQKVHGHIFRLESRMLQFETTGLYVRVRGRLTQGQTAKPPRTRVQSNTMEQAQIKLDTPLSSAEQRVGSQRSGSEAKGKGGDQGLMITHKMRERACAGGWQQASAQEGADGGREEGAEAEAHDAGDEGRHDDAGARRRHRLVVAEGAA